MRATSIVRHDEPSRLSTESVFRETLMPDGSVRTSLRHDVRAAALQRVDPTIARLREKRLEDVLRDLTP